MTWKSYAVVSGATALATWIASSAPSNAPSGAATPPQGLPAAAASAASEIEEETARLRMRLRPGAEYQQPERNPFRFDAAEPPPREPEPAEPEWSEPAAYEPPPPPITLAGIAEDRSGARMERTAVLGAPSGALLVREGDVVLGLYRVARIENEAVELVTLADGSVLRLAF